MNIPEIIIKIKKGQGIKVVLSMIIIIGNGTGLFLMGMAFGASKTSFQKPVIIYPPKVDLSTPQRTTGQITQNSTSSENSGKIELVWEAVASKSGKVYYPKNCTAYSRIKEENRVYFNSILEAQESGRTLSSLCNR